MIDIRLLKYAKSLDVDVSSPELQAHLQRETDNPGSTLCVAACVEIYGGKSHYRRDGRSMWVPPGKKVRMNIHGEEQLIDA